MAGQLTGLLSMPAAGRKSNKAANLVNVVAGAGFERWLPIVRVPLVVRHRRGVDTRVHVARGEFRASGEV